MLNMSVPRKSTQSFPNALVFPMYGLEWRVVYPGSFVLGDEVDAGWPVPPDYYSQPHNKAFNQHGRRLKTCVGRTLLGFLQTHFFWCLCKSCNQRTRCRYPKNEFHIPPTLLDRIIVPNAFCSYKIWIWVEVYQGIYSGNDLVLKISPAPTLFL